MTCVFVGILFSKKCFLFIILQQLVLLHTVFDFLRRNSGYIEHTMIEDSNSYKIHEFVAHGTQVNCLTFGPLSTQVLATGGEDFKVNIWRLDNAANIWTLKQNKSPIECLCFDGEEQYICSGAMNGSIKVFDLNEGKLARNLRGHQIHVTTVHYHPYGEFIVSGSFDHSMKVWDVRNKTCVQTYTGHDKELTCAKFSPDGRWVASAGKDGQVLIWDLIAGLRCIYSCYCG
jgi:katanin p80 WD40 repeat-containing subunit B1